MAVRNFNDAEKQKLIQIISQGSQVLGEVDGGFVQQAVSTHVHLLHTVDECGQYTDFPGVDHSECVERVWIALVMGEVVMPKRNIELSV